MTNSKANTQNLSFADARTIAEKAADDAAEYAYALGYELTFQATGNHSKAHEVGKADAVRASAAAYVASFSAACASIPVQGYKKVPQTEEVAEPDNGYLATPDINDPAVMAEYLESQIDEPAERPLDETYQDEEKSYYGY